MRQRQERAEHAGDDVDRRNDRRSHETLQQFGYLREADEHEQQVEWPGLEKHRAQKTPPFAVGGRRSIAGAPGHERRPFAVGAVPVIQTRKQHDVEAGDDRRGDEPGRSLRDRVAKRLCRSEDVVDGGRGRLDVFDEKTGPLFDAGGAIDCGRTESEHEEHDQHARRQLKSCARRGAAKCWDSPRALTADARGPISRLRLHQQY